MTTIRIILFRSSNDASWFLSRKARELIDHYLINPIELFFVYDSAEKIPLFVNSLRNHRIPFRKLENFSKIQKASCILVNLKSFYDTDIFPQGYLFFLLSHGLEERRIDLVRQLKDQKIREAYLALCGKARQEGEDLSYLLNAEMVTDVEWRDPGTVYFGKKNDHWRPYWQGVPRWMVPEMLLRIAEALAKHQDGFLEKGFSKMAALTMKEIASSVGCAESSVSRIIYGVEAETPWGRLPLKCFFSQKVPSTHGLTSQTSIIEKVVKLIGTEDKQKPLSDEDIVKTIRQEGIEIARRTITKYRQKIGIATSSERKKDENNVQTTSPDSETKSSMSITTSDRPLHITPRKTVNENKSSNITSSPGKDYLVISKTKGQETANPIDAEVSMERGKRYEDDGKYELAIGEYEKAIAFNPNEGRAYLGAGINFERIGKREKAVFCYKIAVKLGNEEASEFLRSMGIE